jgi:hypothetical protein
MTALKLINVDGHEFDTEDWRKSRDVKLMEWIGDASAVNFILSFSDLCEVFDDLIDKDKPVTDDDIIRTLFTALVDIPMNPFFAHYRHQLVPVVITGINAWLDANKLERGSDNDKVFALCSTRLVCGACVFCNLPHKRSALFCGLSAWMCGHFLHTTRHLTVSGGG